MKKLKLIYFVIALFELALNSSVWARGGHYRSHIGELGSGNGCRISHTLWLRI